MTTLTRLREETDGHCTVCCEGFIRAERAAADAEIARLREVCQDYRNFLAADGAECTCEPDDVCPLCRLDAVLPAKGAP